MCLALVASLLSVPLTAQAATATIALGSGASYSALGGTSVSNSGSTVVMGSVGAGSSGSISGFPPGKATGSLHSGDTAAARAHTDLVAAYRDAESRIPTATITGDLAGLTLVSGVYGATAAVSLSTTLTLDGQDDPTSVFIFQIPAAFSAAAATQVKLIRGAQAGRVFWQVTGAVTLGADATFTGSVLGYAAITVGASAAVVGRVLSVNGSVTLSSNAINPESPVQLGTAGSYSALGAVAVTNTGGSTMSANVGVSPGSNITGFPPGLTSGSLHPGDAEANQAQVDLHAAFADVSAREKTASLSASLNGLVLTAGVYQAVGSVALSSAITLDGQSNPNSIFILRIPGGLSVAANSRVVLLNSASPDRVFWQIADATDIGATSNFSGTVLGLGSIHLGTGTHFTGRALSLTNSIVMDDIALETLVPVAINTAVNYSLLGGTALNNTGATVVNFNVGTSPSAAVSGFPPGISTSGAVHQADENARLAQADAQTAYSDSLERPPTLVVTGDLAGLTLQSGVFFSAAALSLSGTLVLDGQNNPNAVFIFKVNAAFGTAAYSVVRLINGAQLDRVFWQVSGAATLGANSIFYGNLVSPAAIALGQNMTLHGRVISLNGAVSCSTASVLSPSPDPGTLTATSDSVTLTGVLLNGTSTQYSTGQSKGWSIADLRDSGAGWTMSVSATDLVSAGGSVESVARVLPPANLEIDPGTITSSSGADTTANLTSTSLMMSGASQSMVASSGSSRGTYAFNPTFRLSIPAEAFRSNFSGEINASPLNPYITVLTVTIS
ncbi:MAG: DUF3494 domain-containing protein [Microbacteriaceae bacterium]|nr:DUF3494 domain-containing protein [Microbacteriaceae bacterium]